MMHNCKPDNTNPDPIQQLKLSEGGSAHNRNKLTVSVLVTTLVENDETVENTVTVDLQWDELSPET